MKKPTLSCSACGRPMWKGAGSKTDGTQKCQPCRRASPREGEAVRICLDCGTEYGWQKDARCSKCRYQRAQNRALASGKICSECPRPAVASGLCSTHASYKSRAVTGRNRKYATYRKTCRHCDEEFTTTGRDTEFCSPAHFQRYRSGWNPCTDVVVRLKPRIWVGQTLPSRQGEPLVAGECSHCTTYFVGASGMRYCSRGCSGRAAWKRQYDRRGEFSVSTKERHAIYERDGWICQLCELPVDPDAPANTFWSATLDHIIPQSRQLIPDHSPANLRLAHMWCNSLRGDGSNMTEDEFRRRIAERFQEVAA